MFTSMPKYPKIENMDGFVYTICCHCWSKFYRKNKKHWHSENINIDDMQNLSDDTNLQNEVENNVLIEKMKTEIAYLSKLHRDIITLTYYDGKSSAQVSKELKIPDSTVRWHLVEIRKKLKGRIENMNTETLNCKPVALTAWQDGDRNSTRGVGQYRLVDNICWLCYGKPLTIEEISQKLSVAAVFIEQHLEELVFMDYMTLLDGNKYQTNFFIRTQSFEEIATQYNHDNVKNKAGKLYDALEKRYADIAAINFLGSDLDKDFLMWVLLHRLIVRLENKANAWSAPKRKDGSAHWLTAVLKEDNCIGNLPDEVKKYRDWALYRESNAWAPEEVSSFQMTTHALFKTGGDRRIYWGDELLKIRRVAEIARNNLAPGDYDKMLVATCCEAGLVKVEGDKISMMIPYLTKIEHDKLDEILSETEMELGDDYFVDFIKGYMKQAKAQIPEFLPESEKNHIAAGITCRTTIPYYLADIGKLRYPTDEEAKRLGIIIWELK